MLINYIAPCRFGLEKTLSFELKKLGAEDVRAEDGRVFFSGNAEICAKANIFCSTAERICVVLGKFRAETFDDLFENIKKYRCRSLSEKTTDFRTREARLNQSCRAFPRYRR